MLSTGSAVVADGGSRIQERLARAVVEQAGAGVAYRWPISTISAGE
ncbi:hypothetical protein BZL29_5487 [Mycobacterium kansasii]|uniref:Uncharacterized protein n=1 Tax=Mycobacterium kansasii TaxID=1768 RepID=A0A1V3WWJ1_MYCKA|nr:hypothetical protein BZL29_5487 [Mycobacterium kansasii]